MNLPASPLPLVIDGTVRGALAGGAPVVALESTIVSHGMPYPENVETALSVENLVSENGAVPATIAVLGGAIRVGIGPGEFETLGRARDVVKASGRDLGAVLARGQSAGTTVSATMAIAKLAGIGIFATGGIGGVHRGAEETFDISADLIELGRTPVAVVCAGVKSILDIPRTLEVLETQRVPVLAYRSDDFPAFYTRSSGMTADHRFDEPEDIARAIRLHHALGTGTGVLVANPIPEADALDPAFIDGLIGEALAEAGRRGIVRKEVTPFLLSEITRLSGGRSLAANIALIRNNAVLAARIASALSADRGRGW